MSRQVYSAIARSLREFGYSDVTSDMIAEIHAAMRNGATELPHGIIGMFAEGQLQEAKNSGLL